MIIKTVKTAKTAPHEKAAVVNLFLEFIGNEADFKKYSYTYWLRQVGNCDYGEALSIIKSLESLPIKYSKAGTIINKLRKFNAGK